MKNLTVLIADDVYGDYKVVEKWLSTTILCQDENKFLHCEFIERNDENGLSQILSMGNIDIAFVDLAWEKETNEHLLSGEQGGKEIIKRVKKQFPNCLIIALSKHIGSILQHPVYQYDESTRYPAISKDEPNDEKTARLYDYLDKWQLERIRKINNPNDWRNIYQTLTQANEGNAIMISFLSREYNLSDFLIPETEFNGKSYFRKGELIKEISKLLSYPQKGKWGKPGEWGAFTKLYFRFLELDDKENFKKLAELEEKASSIIRNRIERLKNNAGNTRYYYDREFPELSYRQYNANTLNQNIDLVSSIDPKFFDNLLIRLVILTIAKMADQLQQPAWKNCRTLVELFFDTSDVITVETIRQFMLCTGIKTHRSFVSEAAYDRELFFKEKDFIEEFLKDL